MTRIVTFLVCISAVFACQDIQSQKDIIETTDSGYRYQLSKDLPGETVQPGQYALIHYVLRHQDSVMVNTYSSPGRPTLVKLDPPAARRGTSSGPLQDLLELLSEGDSARLYYPVDSFPVKPQNIRQFKEITYDISVVDIFETDDEMQMYKAAELERINEQGREFQMKEQAIAEAMGTFYRAYEEGQKKDQWQTTRTGLKYIVLEASDTGIKAKPGDLVRTNYYGMFEADGKKFDSSFGRGATLDFTIGAGQVIPAWEEAFQIVEKGDKAIILAPSELAYGSRGYPGAIPPDADLFFYIELVGIGDED